jgi:stage II sporulation protein AA (anti-sigma F factor antagonist)
VSMEVARERHGGVLVLAPVGRLDNDNAEDFELLVQEAIGAGERHLVLDLARLDYLSNAGLRALGRMAKSLGTPSTSLRLAGLSPTLQQVLASAGVAVLFDVRPDRAAALADHPAAGGGRLASEVARLLGVGPDRPQPAPAGVDVARLAELAFDMLGRSGRQTRAVRALAQGTQVMQRAVPGPGVSPAASRKPGFWQRLFGRKG